MNGVVEKEAAVSGEIERDHPLGLGLTVGVVWIIIAIAVSRGHAGIYWLVVLCLLLRPILLGTAVSVLLPANDRSWRVTVVRLWSSGFPVASLFGLPHLVIWLIR